MNGYYHRMWVSPVSDMKNCLQNFPGHKKPIFLTRTGAGERLPLRQMESLFRKEIVIQGEYNLNRSECCIYLILGELLINV